MKKWLGLLAIVLVAVGVVAALGLAEGNGAQPQASPAPEQTAGAQPAPSTGSVYYLNFKPEQSQQWERLATSYTNATGVPVTVVTAASGTYEDTLRSEMEKAEAPTLFQVNGPVGLRAWREPGLPGRYCPESAALAIAAAFQELRKGGNEDA